MNTTWKEKDLADGTWLDTQPGKSTNWARSGEKEEITQSGAEIDQIENRKQQIKNHVFGSVLVL